MILGTIGPTLSNWNNGFPSPLCRRRPNVWMAHVLGLQKMSAEFLAMNGFSKSWRTLATQSIVKQYNGAVGTSTLIGSI